MSESEIKWDVPVRLLVSHDEFTRTRKITLDGKAFGEWWAIDAEWDDAWGADVPRGVVEDLHRRFCEGILRERAKGKP